jgi:phage repressor protein C with HTH and peptisase S24 domain
MVDYKDRLAKAMKLGNVPVQQLADAMGISYQAVKRTLEGKSSAFTAANNTKAARFLGVRSDWLATGEGFMFDSRLNDEFAEVLAERGVRFKKLEPHTPVTVPDAILRVRGQESKYFPDFVVTRPDNSQIFIEVKPQALMQEDGFRPMLELAQTRPDLYRIFGPGLRWSKADIERFVSDVVDDGTGVYHVSEPIPSYIKDSESDLVIQQFDAGGAMGHGLVMRDQPGIIQSWKVTPEWVQKNVPYCTATNNLAIVTGFGDSMLGMFNPGDPLLIDRGIIKADVDGVYFFRVGDEGFIKRLQRIPGQGILVISENPKYRDWTIQPDMDFQVLGKVLKAWHGVNL